jgi:hypothetical protein
MSALETQTKPVLSRLIDRPVVTLTPQDQRCLSLWAAKTAMTVALARRGRVAVPKDHFHALAATQEPPFRAEVWLAAHHGEYVGCSTHIDQNEFTAQLETAAPTTSLGTYMRYSITVNVMGVVLQLVADTMPRHWILEGASEPELSAIRIWPPTNRLVVWPPPRVLDDDDLTRWASVRPPSAAQFDASA